MECTGGGSKFARDQLAKYGWKEGKGLGKNEDGIDKPIKASLKFNKTGVGYDPGQDFSFQWWDHVFNSAAKSIVVENSQDGVEVKTISNTPIEVSTKKPSKKSKKSQYGIFVKTGTLNDGKVEQQDVTDNFEDSGNDLSSRLSAEELFKACGSCTAHKAARHGHKLNGKLKRLQAQERKHLELVQKNNIERSSQEIVTSKLNKTHSLKLVPELPENKNCKKRKLT